jgi:hypothetical protein
VITLNEECAYAEEEKKEELSVPRNELISGTGGIFLFARRYRAR